MVDTSCDETLEPTPRSRVASVNPPLYSKPGEKVTQSRNPQVWVVRALEASLGRGLLEFGASGFKQASAVKPKPN